MGIDAQTLPLIFDLFKQAERTLGRSQGGLGVGLTMVKRLVELHGRTVEAASAGIGKGSEFTVRLPLASSEAQRKSNQQTAKRPKAGPSLRVLVVDDNQDAADSLKKLLALSGHEVHAAYSRRSGLEEAIRWQPEVMLLDIGLPKMDGYEVARRLRERPEMENVVLIALTGHSTDADRQHSYEAGFQYHLVKPVPPQHLDEILTVVASEKPASSTLATQ